MQRCDTNLMDAIKFEAMASHVPSGRRDVPQYVPLAERDVALPIDSFPLRTGRIKSRRDNSRLVGEMQDAVDATQIRWMRS